MSLLLQIMPLIFAGIFIVIYQLYVVTRQNIRLKRALKEFEYFGDLLLKLGEINLSRAKDLRKLTGLIENIQKHKR